MKLLTQENGTVLLRVLRELKASSRKVRAEWSHTNPGGKPGAVDSFTAGLSIHTRSSDSEWSIIVSLGDLGLVFPTKWVPGANDELKVYFEVQGKEVLFELQEGELTHTRRLSSHSSGWHAPPLATLE